MAKNNDNKSDETASTSIVNEAEVALTVAAAEDTSFLLGTMAEQQEMKATAFVIPRFTVYVPGKKGTDKGATSGFWIDFLNGVDYEVNIPQMRFHRMDLHVLGRIMWAFDENDVEGKKLQGSEYKDPWCGSSDGVSPRQGDRFNYVGSTHIDYRNHKPVTIGTSCAACPFSQWLPLYEADGTPMMESDGRGNLRSKNGKPPCDPTPKFPIYDVNGDRVLLFQTSGFVRNTHVLGSSSRGRFGAIMSINDYYNVDPKTKRPPIVDENGGIHALIATVKMVDAGRGNGYQPAPVLRIDPEPMTKDELRELASKQRMYLADNGRAIISGNAFDSVFSEEEQGFAPVSNGTDKAMEDMPF